MPKHLDNLQIAETFLTTGNDFFAISTFDIIDEITKGDFKVIVVQGVPHLHENH